MHTNHQDIKSRASEFLLSGPSPDLEVNSVCTTAKDLIAEINQANDQTALVDELSDVQERAKTLLSSLTKTDVMVEFRQYSSVILQEQLLVMARCVEELKSNAVLEKYPLLVQKILRNCPQVMPQNSKIFNFLNTSVQEIRQRLLSDFHRQFESHLLKSEELTTHSSSSSSSSTQGDSSWESFLSSSQGWILAYMMVSLLPTAARGCTSSQLLEGYQDCLDSAFTPLWGRFYFHLTSSRDAGSMEQILWTFEYTHTFIHLLLGFCTNLTTFNSDLVLTFPGADFRQAGIAQIIEKTCRFMRSHVAECLVILNPLPLHSPEYSSSSSQICMSLVEHSLLLDHDIHKFQHGIGDYSHSHSHTDNNNYNNDNGSDEENRGGGKSKANRPLIRTPLALPVSAVFCSNPVVRNLWLHFDHASFRGALLESMSPRRLPARGGRLEEKYAASLEEEGEGGGAYTARHPQDEEDLFECYFGSSPYPQQQRQQSQQQQSQSQPQSQGCFACVYDCLILFHKAYQRYSYLPREAQDLFSAYVLEPLLLTALGLVMFRTNTCPALELMLACQRLPFHLRPGSKPAEGIAIVQTVQYLQDFLLGECDTDTDTDTNADTNAGAGAGADVASLLAEDGASFLRQQFRGSITPPAERFADCWSLLQAWVRTPDRRYVSDRRYYRGEQAGAGVGPVHSGAGSGSVGGDGGGESSSSPISSSSEVRAAGAADGAATSFCAYDVVEKAFHLAETAAQKLRDRKKQSFMINTNSQEKMCDLAEVVNFTRRESTLMSDKLNQLLDKVSNQSVDSDIYLR